MNGFIKKSSAVFAAACLLLTGCGEHLQAVTPEEEAIIVTYASGIVAKANKKQEQGMIRMVSESPQDTKQPEGEKEQEPQTPDKKAEPETEPAAGDDTTKEPAKPVPNTATLTEALGMDSITAEYNGYQISKSYVQGGYFALEERNGYSYLIMNITLGNQSEQPLICDLLSASTGSQLIINGAPTAVSAINTFLINDFSSYVETIAAKSSVDTVLIFEVKNEDIQEIQSLSMNLTIHGNEYNIPLE